MTCLICDKTLFVSTDPQKPIFCLVFLLEKSEKEEEDFEEYDGVTAASLLLYYLANQLNFHLITIWLTTTRLLFCLSDVLLLLSSFFLQHNYTFPF